MVFDDGAGSALYVDGDFDQPSRPADPGHRPLGRHRLDSGRRRPGPRGRMLVYDSGGGPALFFTGSFLEAGGLSAYNVAQYCRPGVFAGRLRKRPARRLSAVFP